MIAEVYLDASFVLALLVPNHPFQADVRKKMTLLKKATLFISFFTLNEVIFILTRYDLSREQISKILRQTVFSWENLYWVSGRDSLASANSYLELWGDSGLKPTDAMHLFIMKQRNLACIATFDADFLKREEKLGIKIL